MTQAVKDQGLMGLGTVGLPSMFGVGVQTYDSNKKPSSSTSQKRATLKHE